jgi:hypothetical protein
MEENESMRGREKENGDGGVDGKDVEKRGR